MTTLVALCRLVAKKGEAVLGGYDCPVLVWGEPTTPLRQEFAPQRTFAPGEWSRTRAGEAVVLQLRKSEGVRDEFASAVTVGRSITNDIALDHHTVSRFHAFFSGAPAWTVTDPGSHNGTFVDGERLAKDTPCPLHDGARVRFGSVEVEFLTPQTFRAQVLTLVRGARGT